jgi:uncharacterized protein (TIGR03437 family)
MPRFCLIFLTSLLCTSQVPAQLIVHTVAGGKIQSGNPASDAVIGSIGGITRDPGGNIVFSEPTRYIIRRIRTDDTIDTIAGAGSSGYSGDGGPATSAVFSSPSVLQYDGAGNLYIADGARIRRIDSKGIVTTVMGTGIYGSLGEEGPAVSAQVGYIQSIAIDSGGNLYFSESVPPNGANRIRRLTTGGHIELVAGSDLSCQYCGSTGDGGPATEATFNGVGESLVFDNSANLYLSDDRRVRLISPDGTINSFSVLGPDSPFYNLSINGLTIDATGLLYLSVANPVAGNPAYIIRVSKDGSATALAGGGKGQDGPALQAFLDTPRNLCPDGNGGILFSGPNRFNQADRLRHLTWDGDIFTLAGGAAKSAPDGTPATDAWLASPSAIALNSSSQLYIFEQATCLIRRVENDGRLSTVAGTGKCGTSITTGNAISTDLPPTNQIAVDSTGRIYGAATFFIYSISSSGAVSRMFGDSGIPLPMIAVDSKDRLYTASFLGNGISRTNPDGTSQPLGVYVSQGLATIGIDSDDNLYAIGAASNGQGNIYYILQDAYPAVLGGTVFSGLYFNPLLSITGQSRGHAWYTDGIHINRSDVSFHGTYGQVQGFSGDGGPAASAFYSNPASLHFSATGDLYILDVGNNRVRRITGSAPSERPTINQGGIVNSASLTGGGIAPGELVAIFGANFGFSSLQTAAPQNNIFRAVLGSTRVFFNGIAGAITAGTSGQINVFVPYGVSGSSVSVVVDVDGIQSAPLSVPLVSSAIGFYTANGSGAGQASIVNQDGSINGASNPAAPGSIISIYGTGEGAITPALPDGALVLSIPLSAPRASPINATLGKLSARILYAGSAPTLSAGVFQINIEIPPDTPSGDIPVSVSVGTSASTSRITVAVR